MMNLTRNLVLTRVQTAQKVGKCMSLVPEARLFKDEFIRRNIKPSAEIIQSIENAFIKLADGKVDVPSPMHIDICETKDVGPGASHIKGGYIVGEPTWTVKVANVGFTKNIKRQLSPGSGVFLVFDAASGFPLGVLQENRYLTDLRTGAAGAAAVKHFAKSSETVAFIGVGAIAKAMAISTHCIHQFKQGYAYGLNPQETEMFCSYVKANCGYPVHVCSTARDAVSSAQVIFTQTPATSHVVQLAWLKEGATIIASGADQPSKNEIPPEVMKKSKFITDLTKQCVRIGELRTGVQSGAIKESDVYAELGEVFSGKKLGREGSELILVDLTGTGAQDAAIGQVAWNVLSQVPLSYV